MKKTLNIVAGVAVLTALAGCGNYRDDRILTGAAIGAGTGALIGSATGGNPWAGAAIGGVAGGVIANATTGEVRMKRHRRHHRNYQNYNNNY